MTAANTPTARLIACVEQRMITDGTIARLDAKDAQYLAVAQSLGYPSAQQAYNRMGKNFLAIAKRSC